MRGYGGLQKFLVARRGASDISNSLEIADDGSRVTIASTETVSSSRQDDSVADDRGTEERTWDEASVEQGSTGGLGVRAGAATAAFVDTAVSIDGTSTPPSTCLATATAALSFTPSLPGPSCKAPCAETCEPPVALATEEKPTGHESSRGSNGGDGAADRRRLPEPGPLTIESLSGVELVCGDIFQEAWYVCTFACQA